MAVGELLIVAEGGTVALTDTDSLAVVGTNHGGLVLCPGGVERLPDGTEAVRALSWEQINTVCQRLNSLKPYDPSLVPEDVLQLTDENFIGTDPSAPRRQLRLLAIAAKRYALYVRDDLGRIEPVKLSRHGLGHLLDPGESAALDD